MTRVFSNLVLGISALFMASCTEAPKEKIFVKHTIYVSNNLSKTSIGEDNFVHWIDGEDQIRVFETVDNLTVTTVSNPCVMVDNAGLFDFTLEERYTANKNYYDAVYPPSAWVEGSLNVNQISLNLKSEQKPSQGFDPDADILIAKTVIKDVPTDWFQTQFKRIVSIARLTINNLNTSDKVHSVKFIVDNKVLSGDLSVDLRSGEVLSYGGKVSNNYVTATYSEIDGFTNGSQAVFTCFPAALVPGDKFTIEVCSSSKKYTKTFTIPAEREIIFKMGDVSKFSVNMSGAKEELIKAEESHTYYIVAEHGGAYHAMSNVVTGSSKDRLASKTVTITDGVVNPSDDPSIIWTIIEQPNGNVVISNDGLYLSSTAAKKLYLISTPVEYRLNQNADGTYRIANPAVKESDSRYLELRYNGNKEGGDVFCFYTSYTNANMIGDVMIIPAGGEPVAPQLSTPTGLTASVDGVDPNRINISWNAVENATSYLVKCGEQTKEVNTNETYFSGLSAGTYSISLTALASGYKNSEAANTSCNVTGAAGGGDEVIITNIEISKKSSSSLGVYIYGANLDRASSLKVYYTAAAITKSIDASISNSSYASVILNSLSSNTEYSIYAQAIDNGSPVNSETITYTITLSALEASKGWLELPAQTSIAKTKEYTLYAGERNYSFLYDTYTRSSLWVAYPLAKGHMGSEPRPGSWNYCSLVPNEYQQVLKKGYDCTGEQVSRGHQIANADRNGNSTMQKQTFLFINSTPQLQNKFNGGIWNNLETAIQNEAKSISDTVYVVTGPVYQTVGGNETVDWNKAKDNNGKACPIPNYYFKVVMKVHRSGSSITDAMAVGFWFEHKNYTDSYTNYAVSVDQIESLTGFNFYPNLPEEIEAKAEQNSSWSKFTSF